jgi:hypothetical protein
MGSTLSMLEQAGILTGVIAGVGGLALGVLNWFQQRSESRPRLRVRFSIMTMIDRTHGPGGQVEHGVGVVEVANVGRLPVVASLVGVKTGGPTGALVVSPTSFGGEGLPTEIAPGHVCHLRCNVDSLQDAARTRKLKRAYVKSAVGDIFHGSRKEARQFARDLLAFSAPSQKD